MSFVNMQKLYARKKFLVPEAFFLQPPSFFPLNWAWVALTISVWAGFGWMQVNTVCADNQLLTEINEAFTNQQNETKLSDNSWWVLWCSESALYLLKTHRGEHMHSKAGYWQISMGVNLLTVPAVSRISSIHCCPSTSTCCKKNMQLHVISGHWASRTRSLKFCIH